MTAGKDSLAVRLARWGRFAEDGVLVILLTGMIVLACTQILLRNVFDTGLIWADELLRILVLWLALAGAVAASRADRHINIDVLSRWLPSGIQSFISALIDLFTAAVCGLLAYHAWRFVSEAREFEDTLLGGVPAWYFQVVLPVGFLLMTWRYLTFGALHTLDLVARREPR